MGPGLMKTRLLAALLLTFDVTRTAFAQQERRIERVTGQTEAAVGSSLEGIYYARSCALVIGVNDYPRLPRGTLLYARKDAEAIARFLRGQGFEVTALYDSQATRTAIISKMHALARSLEKDDRVVMFFAGHGHTERLGQQDHGYIIPYDGDLDSATYVSMDELRAQSEKMANAKHQLFIMDACYGGLLQRTRSLEVPSSIPNYIRAVTTRRARQILTAGGPDQQVLDQGPDGHSVFTGYLLRGLREGLADRDGDGFITFAELSAYLIPAATKPGYQTPGSGILPGHELGEFVFRAPAVQPGLLVLNALPWAEITSILGLDGRDWAAGARRYTPLALPLPPGAYFVTFNNPHFPNPISMRATVEAGGIQRKLAEFARIDPAEYFKKAGF